jgi:uncharacterized protein YndB with AHSA1/START domain/dihydrofolate reductase
MKTQYYTASSLDGFLATLDDSLEWLFPLGDINDTSYPAFIKEVGALAMGSATYLWMLRHVVKRGSDTPGAWPYAQPTWVFTTGVLPEVDGADIRFVRGSVATTHRKMRNVAQGKNIWIVGGGDLAGQFYDAGLLDEVIVQVGSVTLGRGKPLLPRQIVSPSLKLVSAQRIGAGFAELRYEVMKNQTIPHPDSTADREFVHSRLIDAPRERLFRAFAQPAHLAQWWGPDGFSNTFETFDLRVGGQWRFVMHGPDGSNYPNEMVFRELVAPERVVLEHLGSKHHFFLAITFTEAKGKTLVGWRQVFDTAQEKEAIAQLVVPANEQNLNRLEIEVRNVL